MMNLRPNRQFALVVLGTACQLAHAANYQVLPTDLTVLPGSTSNLSVQVQTEPGDNVVDIGYFSFAIDLSIGGTAGADANSIGDVFVNTIYFDDLLALSTGAALGNQYVGIAGVTTDLFAPNFGRHVGDQIALFTFDVTIPLDALLGETITITPFEGVAQNLIPNDAFDPVTPQNFSGSTLNVVPEPATGFLLFAALLGARFIRKSSLPLRGG